MALTNQDISTLYRYLRRDTSHTKCLVMLYVKDGDGYAYAVADGESGRIIAWDGVYYDPGEPPASVAALASLDWENWDDMPSKLVVEKQTHWVNQRMAAFLMPTFSPARNAAELVDIHRDSETDSDMVHTLRHADVVAYLPVVDEDV